MHLTRLSAVLLAALTFSVVACDDASTDGGEEGGPQPDSTSGLVTAQDGGAITLADGAGVTIPAGALAADTTITIASTEPSGLPDASALRGLTYEFGPNGTAFLIPVTLALPMPGTPAAGETAVLSWLDETANEWVDLPSTVAGGKIAAPVQHFTRFIVRFKPGALPGECNFTACGGDAVGTWTLDSACLNSDQNPFAEQCPTATFQIDISGATGSLEIVGDGTYSADFHLTGSLSYTLPSACIGPVTDCTQLSNAENGSTCAAAAGGDGCTCTSPIQDDGNPPDTGTWTASGNEIVTTDSDPGSTPDTSEYCVDGNVLKISMTKDGQTQILTLTK